MVMVGVGFTPRAHTAPQQKTTSTASTSLSAGVSYPHPTPPPWYKLAPLMASPTPLMHFFNPSSNLVRIRQ